VCFLLIQVQIRSYNQLQTVPRSRNPMKTLFQTYENYGTVEDCPLGAVNRQRCKRTFPNTASKSTEEWGGGRSRVRASASRTHTHTHTAVTCKQMAFISHYGTYNTSSWRTGTGTWATSWRRPIKRGTLTEDVTRTPIADYQCRDDSLKAENNISISPISAMWSRPVLTGFMSTALRHNCTSLGKWHYNCTSAGTTRRLTRYVQQSTLLWF
jgi:hypothetical protein